MDIRSLQSVYMDQTHNYAFGEMMEIAELAGINAADLVSDENPWAPSWWVFLPFPVTEVLDLINRIYPDVDRIIKNTTLEGKDIAVGYRYQLLLWNIEQNAAAPLTTDVIERFLEEKAAYHRYLATTRSFDSGTPWRYYAWLHIFGLPDTDVYLDLYERWDEARELWQLRKDWPPQRITSLPFGGVYPVDPVSIPAMPNVYPEAYLLVCFSNMDGVVIGDETVLQSLADGQTVCAVVYWYHRRRIAEDLVASLFAQEKSGYKGSLRTFRPWGGYRLLQFKPAATE